MRTKVFALAIFTYNGNFHCLLNVYTSISLIMKLRRGWWWWWCLWWRRWWCNTISKLERVTERTRTQTKFCFRGKLSNKQTFILYKMPLNLKLPVFDFDLPIHAPREFSIHSCNGNVNTGVNNEIISVSIVIRHY